jgi:hypothetical protein
MTPSCERRTKRRLDELSNLVSQAIENGDDEKANGYMREMNELQSMLEEARSEER